RVNIDYMKTAFARQPHHARKQFKTIRTTPLRILIGKMFADIAFAKRTQDGVSNRMYERVRVRMSVRSEVRDDTHTAQHELSTLNESMRISPYSDPYHLNLSLKELRQSPDLLRS